MQQKAVTNRGVVKPSLCAQEPCQQEQAQRQPGILARLELESMLSRIEHHFQACHSQANSGMAKQTQLPISNAKISTSGP